MTTDKLLSIYLGLVSLFCIVALSVNAGIFFSNTAKLIIISDEEYIEYSTRYEVDNCSEPKYLKDGEREERTEEEIKECETNAIERAELRRSYDGKRDAIESLSWLIVFSILFGFHYKAFLRRAKES